MPCNFRRAHESKEYMREMIREDSLIPQFRAREREGRLQDFAEVYAMKLKLAALLTLFALGLASCYTIPGDSGSSYNPPVRSADHHRREDRAPHPVIPPPVQAPEPAHPLQQHVRETVPSYVPPPQPAPTPKPAVQPRPRGPAKPASSPAPRIRR